MRHYRFQATFHAVFFTLILLTGLQPALAVDTAGFDKGLLWEVSKDGKTMGYVLGTIHSEDPRVLAAAKELSPFLAKSKGLAIEVEMTPDTMMAAQMAMMLPETRTLQAIVGDELFAKVVPLAAQHGIPENLVQHMQPWAVAMTLSMPPSGGGLPLDLKLFAEANSAGMHTSGLESLQEQLSVFTTLAEADQVLMLKETLQFYDQIGGYMEQMHGIWLQKDLKKLMNVNEEMMSLGDQDMNERLMRKLLHDRNLRMAERIDKLLQQRNTFVAIGTLHLPGGDGVLAGLRGKGYSLKAVW